MSDGTAIQWTDATWNPIRAIGPARPGNEWALGWHCERVSAGCQHCYAETINEKRFGTGLPYNRKSRDLVDVYLDEKALTQPLHWRRPRKVFVCSMTDLFGEWVPDEMIDRVFAVMALSPQHTFQVLTKRPERMRRYRMYVLRSMIEELTEGYTKCRWPLPNVWLGVSVEDQERADERIPELLATPAEVRFISCEPLLGPVNLRAVKPDAFSIIDALDGSWEQSLPEWEGNVEYVPDGPHIDWIIVGGESGPGARPFDLAWARLVVQQCQAAGVAVFVKQLGAKPYSETRRVVTGSVYPSARAARTYGEEPVILDLRDRKGGDPAEWPEDLRVREFPR